MPKAPADIPGDVHTMTIIGKEPVHLDFDTLFSEIQTQTPLSLYWSYDALPTVRRGERFLVLGVQSLENGEIFYSDGIPFCAYRAAVRLTLFDNQKTNTATMYETMRGILAGFLGAGMRVTDLSMQDAGQSPPHAARTLQATSALEGTAQLSSASGARFPILLGEHTFYAVSFTLRGSRQLQQKSTADGGVCLSANARRAKELTLQGYFLASESAAALLFLDGAASSGTGYSFELAGVRFADAILTAYELSQTSAAVMPCTLTMLCAEDLGKIAEEEASREMKIYKMDCAPG